MNRRARLAPYFLLGVLTLVTGLGVGLGLSEAPVTYPPRVPAAASRSECARQITLVRTIQTDGQAHPNAFAGIEQLADCQDVVYVVRGHDADLLAVLPPVRSTSVGPSYVVKIVDNSLEVLKSVTQRIESDAAFLTSRAITLASWGPDIQVNRVVINMRHYNASQARLLIERYGANLVAVSRSSTKGSSF